MKISAIVKKVRVLAINETPSPDGKNTYYNLAVFTADGECGNVKCNEDVAKSVVVNSECDLMVQYNDTYNPPTFRFVGVANHGSVAK